MNDYKKEYKEMLELLKGSKQDKRIVYDWLISKVVNGETLNFGYRKVLEHLAKEFSNET